MTCLCGRKQNDPNPTRHRCSQCSPQARLAIAAWRRWERRSRVRRSWEYVDVTSKEGLV